MLLQMVFRVDWIALPFNLGAKAQIRLYFFSEFGLGPPAFQKLCIERRMEIRHNAGKAGCTLLHRSEEGRGIGVEQLQPGAPDGL